MEKMQERGRRIKDNNSFRNEEGLFYKSLNSKIHTGKTAETKEFVKFWGDTWESKEKTYKQPWMEGVIKKIES